MFRAWPKNLASIFCAAVLTTACSNSSEPDPTSTGRIVNTAIQGLSYSTPTHSGTTDAQGSFTYEAGESVTFVLGSIEIGTVVGKSEVNWFELVGLETIPTTNNEIQILWNSPDSALTRLAAIASILVTVDDDRNLTNGIIISSEVATRLENVEFDLSAANGPQFDPLFKRFLRHAARDGVLSERRPRRGGFALADVYIAHDVTPDIRVATRQETDNGVDGIINRVSVQTYSAEGRITSSSFDGGGDGIFDQRTDYAYDAEGQSQRITNDYDGDGITDNLRTWVVDGYGDTTYYEEDSNGDGTVNVIDDRTISEDGLWLRREIINSNSSVHIIGVWTADADGNRTRYDGDLDGDGNFDQRVDMTYGEALGPWLTRAQDSDLDGSYDEMRTREYNAAGQLLTDAIDTGNDGTIDNLTTNSFDAEGRQLTSTRDSNGDGNLEYSLTNTWSGEARSRVDVYDDDSDGTADRIFSREYDERGYVTRYAEDRDGDGNDDNIWVYTNNERGDRPRAERDADGDGTIDHIETRTFDAAGNILTHNIDDNADGNPNFIRYYVRDNDGFLTAIEDDNDADGQIDTRSTYTQWQDVGIGFYY